jgi:hypothetical protein
VKKKGGCGLIKLANKEGRVMTSVLQLVTGNCMSYMCPAKWLVKISFGMHAIQVSKIIKGDLDATFEK